MDKPKLGKAEPARQPPPVILALNTANKKLRGCAVTYVGQQSCPKDCRFLGPGRGCYAQYGPMLWGVTRRVNQAGEGMRPVDLARAERRKILGALGEKGITGMPLRLHGVGDCRTNAAAREVAKGAEVWRRTTGAPVWGYTHAWRRVDRESWGRVSILASVEKVRDLGVAWARGYASALVVRWFPWGPKAWKVKDPRGQEWKVVPCPEQSLPRRGIGCRDCGLCWRADWLRANRVVIGFAAHGPGAGRLREELVRIGEGRPGEERLGKEKGRKG